MQHTFTLSDAEVASIQANIDGRPLGDGQSPQTVAEWLDTFGRRPVNDALMVYEAGLASALYGKFSRADAPTKAAVTAALDKG